MKHKIPANLRNSLLLLLIILMVTPIAEATNARVKLVVKKNSYETDEIVKDSFEVSGGHYAAPDNKPPDILITGCGEPPGSAEAWCNVRTFDLASFRCEIDTGLDVDSLSNPHLQLQIDASSSGDHASNYHEVDNAGCISKIRCAYSSGNILISELANVHDVKIASGSWCVNSTSEIYCQSSRSGCNSDGLNCTYTVNCTHRDSN